MIKLAYNKDNTNLVFEIDKVDRVAVGNAGIKEDYVGTLKDYSTNPATETNNYRVQVVGFESDWSEVPVDVASGGGSTINNQDKRLTSNGEYRADDGYTGLGTVTVAVEPALETVDYSVTDNDTYTITKTDPTKDGIGQVNLTVNVPQTVTPVDLDLTTGVKFAHSSFTNATIPQEIIDANWDDVSEFSMMFYQSYVITAPSIDTSNGTLFEGTFGNIYYLENVPVYDLSAAIVLRRMFEQCPSLTNASLNNIMTSLATVTVGNLVHTKPYLTTVGLDSSQIETCKDLAAYPDLIAAGWSTGLELETVESISGIYDCGTTPYDSSIPDGYIEFGERYDTNYILTIEDSTTGNTEEFTSPVDTNYFFSENGHFCFNIYPSNSYDQDSNALARFYNGYYRDLNISIIDKVYDSSTDTTSFTYVIAVPDSYPHNIYCGQLTFNNDTTVSVDQAVTYENPITGTSSVSGDYSGSDITVVVNYDLP